jgi:hypothetical protein
VTAFLWVAEPFAWSGPRAPVSMYFLALSQAPPVFEAEIASWIPETRAPARRPATQFLPKRTPATRGETQSHVLDGLKCGTTINGMIDHDDCTYVYVRSSSD